MASKGSGKKSYGGSVLLCDYILRQQLEKLRPRDIVDFGAGSGKYGKIVRDVLPQSVRITAVEGFDKAVQFLSRSLLYTTVSCSLIQDWLAKDEHAYDLAIFGDVLEHLKPGEIHAVIGRCLGKFKRIVVVCPLHDLHQDEIHGNRLEIHQTWITADFFDRYNIVEKHIVKEKEWTIMNVLISSEVERSNLRRRVARIVFFRVIVVLQFLGLAVPLMNFLKRYFPKYIWVFRN